MTSAIERFRNRVNSAMVLDVPISPGSTELILKVNRFAEAEQNAARKDAEAVVRRVGLAGPDEVITSAHPAYGRFQVEWCEALSKYIERHVKGWTHNPPEGEPVQFSPAALRELFSSMYSNELVDLGLSYLTEVGLLETKKKSPAETATEPSSSNG